MPTDVRSKMQNLIREFEMHASLASIKGESTFLKSSTSSGSNVKKKIEIFNNLSSQSSVKDDVNKTQPEKSFSSPAVCGKPSSSSSPCGWDKSEVSSSLPSVFKKTHDFENVSHYNSTSKTDLKRWWGITNVYDSLTRASSRFLKRRDKTTTKTKDEVSGSSSENDDGDTWKRETIDVLLSNRSRVSCNSTNSSYTNLEIDIFDFENEERRRADGFSSYFKSSRDNTFNDRDSLLNSSAHGVAAIRIKEDVNLETSPEPTTTSPIERKLSTMKDDDDVPGDASWTPTRGANKLSQRKSIGKLLSMVASKLKTIGTKSPKKEDRQCAYSDSGCERSLSSRTDLNCSSLSQKSRSFTEFNSVDKEPLALSTPTFTTFGHADRHRASGKLDEYPGTTTFAEVSPAEEVSHRQSETSRSDFPGDRTPKRTTTIEKRKVHFTSNAISIPGTTGENHRCRIDFPQKFSDEHSSLLPSIRPDVCRRLRGRRISKQFVEENVDQTGDEALSTEDEDEDDVEVSMHEGNMRDG